MFSPNASTSRVESRYLSQTPLAFGAIGNKEDSNRPQHASISDIVSLADDNESKLWPEETIFHDAVQKLVAVRGPVTDDEGGVYCTHPFDGVNAQADLACTFAEECNRRVFEAEEESQRQRNMGTRRGVDMSSVLHAEAREARVERDTWALLDALARADLLRDVDETECATRLSAALGTVDPSMDIRDVVNLSLQTDESLKRLRVLQDWLEKCNADRVSELPAATEPAWNATLGRMRSGHRTLVTHLDPDAQFSVSTEGDDSRDGDNQGTRHVHMLALEGTDVVEQESAMKQIWQCVRSGQVAKAQVAAKDQGMFWLAASLMGVADEFHEVNTMLPPQMNSNRSYSGDSGKAPRTISVRHGNTKKSNWMNVCFDHSQRIHSSCQKKEMMKGNAVSSGGGMYTSASAHGNNLRDDRGMNVAILEASIFGSLSNNIDVLATSPLLREWSDMLWVAVKTHHDRKLHHILHGHKLKRAGQSGLYQGSSSDDLKAEVKYIDRISRNSALDSDNPASTSISSRNVHDAAFSEDFKGMLSQLYPSVATGSNANVSNTMNSSIGHNGTYSSSSDGGVAMDAPFPIVCMWRLQIAVMGGLTTLREHVVDMMHYFNTDSTTATSSVTSSTGSGKGRFSGHNRLLRLYTHLCVWLRTAPEQQPAVSAIVMGNGADCLHDITLKYIETLIHYKRRNLVALYCIFLPRYQRIDTYAMLMQTLSASTRRIGEGGSTVLSEAPNVEATEILNSASVYFRADLPYITRTVLDGARLGSAVADDDVTYSSSIGLKAADRRRPALVYNDHDDDSSAATNANAQDNSYATVDNGSALSLSMSHAPQSQKKRARYETDNDRVAGMTSFSVAANTTTAMSPYLSMHVGSGDSSLGAFNNATGSGGGLFGSRVGQQQEDVSVDNSDVHRMDTLRWLCMDVQDRPDAVKQSNAFIRQFLLESNGGKTNQLRLLLSKILPSDTLSVAEDVYRKSLTSMPECNDALWGAEYCQLKFWYLVNDAFTSIEAYEQVHREFINNGNSLIGGPSVVLNSLARYRPKIIQSCDKAVAAIEATMHCEAGSYEELFEFNGGVRGVWKSGEKCLIQQLCSCLDEAMTLAQVDVDISTNATATLKVSVDLELLDQLHSMAVRLFRFDQTSLSSDSESVRSIVLGLMDRYDSYAVQDTFTRLYSLGQPSEQPSGPATECVLLSPACVTEINALLDAASALMQDIEQRRQVMVVVVGQLIKKWAKILLTSAEMFSTLNDHTAVSKHNQALMHLAVVVADENPGLQLYKLLSTEALRCVLADVTTASIATFESTGSFTVTH